MQDARNLWAGCHLILKMHAMVAHAGAWRRAWARCGRWPGSSCLPACLLAAVSVPCLLHPGWVAWAPQWHLLRSGMWGAEYKYTLQATACTCFSVCLLPPSRLEWVPPRLPCCPPMSWSEWEVACCTRFQSTANLTCTPGRAKRVPSRVHLHAPPPTCFLPGEWMGRGARDAPICPQHLFPTTCLEGKG